MAPGSATRPSEDSLSSTGAAGAEPILVTRPHLPPLDQFLPYLQSIWESRWLTNSGPFHQRLEAALADYLGVEHLALASNGTVALNLALKALEVEGEVITTPFSFVATAHSLLWNGNVPVFADIDAATCNLDPARIEAAITPRTRAIMPVHCYGTPCDVAGIEKIARAHGLTIIYDAAHVFGVRHRGRSLADYGDAATLSFHATKVFSTFEGGAVVCRTAEQKRRIELLRNFGFEDELTVSHLGVNGKMNEVQAAFGLLQLRNIDGFLERRRAIDAAYRRAFSGVPGIRFLPPIDGTTPNGAYFPIFVEPNFPLSRNALYQRLKDGGIFGRRYFYPLISSMPMYRSMPSASADNLPVATMLAAQVLCLPIYPDLSSEDQSRVIQCVLTAAQPRRG